METDKDLRIRRTRRWIQNALISLMYEKEFTDITIGELCGKAEISRPTFYAHYKKKEDVLFNYLELVFQEQLKEFSRIIISGDLSPTCFTEHSYETWKQQAPFLRLLKKHGLETLLYNSMRKNMEHIFDLLIKKNLIKKPEDDDFHYILDYLTGGHFMVLQRWLDSGCSDTSEQMALLITSFLNSIERLPAPSAKALDLTLRKQSIFIQR